MAGTVAVGERSGVHVATLAGEVDHACASAIEREVRHATIDAEGVVLDLSAVTYLDSAGVTLLDHLLRTLGQRGVPARVVVPEDSPARFLLRVVAFDDALLCQDVDAACRSLAPR